MNYAKQRAIERAKSLNISLHNLQCGGRLGDWIDLQHLEANKKIQIRR